MSKKINIGVSAYCVVSTVTLLTGVTLGYLYHKKQCEKALNDVCKESILDTEKEEDFITKEESVV